MLHVKCSKCGWETDVQQHQIKNLSLKCTHIGIDGLYKLNINCCKNKKIGHIFEGMKNRCYNPNSKNYRWYGAKGIKICDEWLSNPSSFEKWALSNGFEDNLTIDRINENKNYCPDNCWWITNKNNSRFKSTTRCLTVDEETLSGRQWAERLDIGINTINTYVRTYGKENTLEFIKEVLKNPNLKNFRGKETYYDLYMG